MTRARANAGEAPHAVPTTCDGATKAYAALHLRDSAPVAAPDGSDVRVLLGFDHGRMAHFELDAGRVSRAVVHRTVDEVWYVVEGGGEMWRRQGECEDIVALVPGVCVTLPHGTQFQFRASPTHALRAVAFTSPVWPGDAEAAMVTGPWRATTR